jgi:hypothetical protein
MIPKQKPIVDMSAPMDVGQQTLPAVQSEQSSVIVTTSDTSDNPGRSVPVDSDVVTECFGDLENFKDELGSLLKSPNPFVLYRQGNIIKEKFSHFVNCLAMQVAGGFSSRNSAFIVSIYYSAGYQKVWLDHFRYYFADAMYFDRQNYFLFVTLFSKDKQLLAKGLLKLYKKESQENIEKFLKAYEGRRFSDMKKPKKLIYTDIVLTYKAL